jgi:hypothetical protein
MDDGSCIVLGGEVCGGLGLCVGNGTCACLPGNSQTLEFHYLGAWDGVESAPCSNRELVYISLVLILAVYSCGLGFQLFITRTLPQLVRAAPTIAGYLLVITPTVVRLAQWGSADMGIMTSAGYSSCLGIAIGAFVGGVGVFLSKYVSFIIKSSKRANFSMTPDTIRKIKLGNMMIYFTNVFILVSMQAWAAGSVVEDRPARGALAKAGWIGLGLSLCGLGAAADYLFSVVQKSFTAFLETVKRMSVPASSVDANSSLKSTLSPGSGGAGRKTSRRSSSLMFSFRRIAPVAGGQSSKEPKNEAVKRIEAQLTVLRKFRRVMRTCIPPLALSFFVVGASDYMIYKFGILWLNVALIQWGVFISGGTFAMYNLGTRKRANNAARQSKLSKTNSAGTQSPAATSAAATSTAATGTGTGAAATGAGAAATGTGAAATSAAATASASAAAPSAPISSAANTFSGAPATIEEAA